MKTVQAKILPGWMTRQEILKVMTEDRVPKMYKQDALDLWNEYKKKIKASEALKERDCKAPALIPLNAEEKKIADEFLKEVRAQGAPTIVDVVKVDASKLIAWQPLVTIDHSENYNNAVMNDLDRMRLTLKMGFKPVQLPQSAFHEDRRYITIDLPHAEFGAQIVKGKIALWEHRGFVATASFADRMLLWNGYHRTYALLSQSKPEFTERLLVATRVTDADFTLGPRSDFPDKRALVRGERPGLLADFFYDTFCITVTLRKWKAQLRVEKMTGKIERLRPDAE